MIPSLGIPNLGIRALALGLAMQNFDARYAAGPLQSAVGRNSTLVQRLRHHSSVTLSPGEEYR
jgi:hypothetical protein